MSDIKDILKHLEDSTYTFEVPLLSNKKKSIIFRPIKTKDQKKLVIQSVENETGFDQFKLLLEMLQNCMVKSKMKGADLYVEDFYWALIKLRAKSIGEELELTANCKHCNNKKNPIVINLENDIEIKYLGKSKDNVVKLTDNLVISLHHIRVEDMVKILYEKDKTKNKVNEVELGLASMIDTIELNEEIVEIESLEDKKTLLSELSEKQLQLFKKFLDKNAFGVSVTKKYKCLKCKKDNEVVIGGYEIISFF